MAAKKKATKETGPGKAAKAAGKKKTEAKPAGKNDQAKKIVGKEPRKAKEAASKPAAKENRKSARGKAEKKPEQKKAVPAAGVTVNLKPAKLSLVAAPGVKISRKNGVDKAVERQTEASKLTKKEIKELKDELLERRDVLLRGIRRELADHRSRSSNRPYDEADMASDAYDEDLTFEITSTSDKELKQIDDALKKIEDGSYGQCDRCGCYISASRLRILPYATACVNCRGKNEFEEQESDENSPWAFIDGNEGEEEEEN